MSRASRAPEHSHGTRSDVVEHGDATSETYSILEAREYRYDEARARYSFRVLDPGELQEDPPNFVGTDTWSQYDGDEIYSDYTIDGQDVTVTTWYEPGVGIVEDVSGTPVVKYYHDNLLGTTRFMTDVDGNKIEGAVYTAFGELISGDPRRFGYAGAYGYQGEEAGEMPFLHVGHRYYDPASGRFLQRDPIGMIGGLNVYDYVRSRPATRIDPNGLRTDMGWDEPPGGYPKPPKPRPPTPHKVSDSIDDMKKQLEATKKDVIFTCALGNLFSAVALPLTIIIDDYILHPGEPTNPVWGGSYE